MRSLLNPLREQYDFIENTFLDAGDKDARRAVNLNTVDEVPDFRRNLTISSLPRPLSSLPRSLAERVRRARGFFDLYDAATQLGLLPSRGGLGETALALKTYDRCRRVLADDVPFRDPASLLVTPDHYVTRLLHADGVPLDRLMLVTLLLSVIVAVPIGVLAAWKAGGVMVSINPMSRQRELSYLLKDSGATALVSLESLYDEVALDDLAPGHDYELAAGFLELQQWELASGHFQAGNPCVYTGEAIFGIVSLFLRDFAPISLLTGLRENFRHGSRHDCALAPLSVMRRMPRT